MWRVSVSLVDPVLCNLNIHSSNPNIHSCLLEACICYKTGYCKQLASVGCWYGDKLNAI